MNIKQARSWTALFITLCDKKQWKESSWLPNGLSTVNECKHFKNDLLK